MVVQEGEFQEQCSFFGFEGYGDVARGKVVALVVVEPNEKVIVRAA